MQGSAPFFNEAIQRSKLVLCMKQCTERLRGGFKASNETKRDQEQAVRIKPWKEAVGELTETFLSYQGVMSAVPREKKRALFYSEFRRMSLAAAMSTIATKNWGGDRFHHAEEITSACVIGLLKQEQGYRGVFQKTLAPFGEIKGYLSQTIWKGVKQHARDRLRKEHHFWNHEQIDPAYQEFIDGKIGAIGLQIDLKAALEKVREEERILFNLPCGVIPLDAVLGKEIASEILAQLPRRSWQRYCKQSRERLAMALDFSRVGGVGK